MSNTRQAILAKLTRPLGPGIEHALHARLQSPLTHPGPTVGSPREALIAQLEALGVGVYQAGAPAKLSAWLVRYLRKQAIEQVQQCHAGRWNLPYQSGNGEATPLLITGVQAAVAESGTLMLCSGDDLDTRSLFLAARHLAIVSDTQIVARQEQAWQLLRGLAARPARVHFITGPSKTADVEQTLVVGAHGPVALDVVLLDA